MVYFLNYKNIYFPTTWRHSNMADQQAVPLIATHINDKALINLKCVVGKV